MNITRNTHKVKLPSFTRGQHYETVAKAIAFLRENLVEQPSLTETAAHVGVSPQYFLEIFQAWAGITPKQLLKVLTLDRAKQHLSENSTTLATSLDCGLSGTGRLHDLFVTVDAMSPGEFKYRGKGLEMYWGFHETPFGNCCIVATPRGVSQLYFLEESALPEMISKLGKTWSASEIRQNQTITQPYIDQIFYGKAKEKPLPLFLKGTPFQVKVWQALLEIPNGTVTAYSALANQIEKPDAHRACASAVGDNPISYLIPCHRVLRKNLALGGYRWGLDRKTAMLATEL